MTNAPWELDAPVNNAAPWESDAPADGGAPWERDAAADGGSYLQGIAGGLNTGLAKLVGAPVDAVNALLSPVGLGSERPFLGSAQIKSAMDGTLGRATSSGTMFPKGPDTPGGRILNRMGEEIGAAALPAAGILKAAGSLPQVAASGAPTLARTFLEPIKNSPGRAALGEAAAATGAGLGAGVAMEAAPDSPLAEMAGQLAGGVAPAVLANMPASLAARAMRPVMNRLSPEAQRVAARETIDDFKNQQLTTQARERLADANRISDEIPGFTPTLAERTGSPGLIRQQEQLESAMSGADLDNVVMRRLANEDAIRRYADEAGPGYPGDVSTVVDVARGRVDDLRARVADDAAGVDARRRDVAARLPEGDMAADGARVRAALQERAGEENLGFQIYAREAGLDDPNFIVPFGDFKRALTDAFESSSQFATETGRRVSVDPPVLKVVREAQEAQSFPALMELRSDISSAIRQAERMPSVDDAQLRGLRAMKAAFDDALESAVRATDDPDIAGRYAGFRKAYLERVVEPLKQRASYDILHKDAQGAYLLPDEKVVGAYFSPGNVTAARQFKSVFGSDPLAQMAVENAALDSFRRAAVRDGTIDSRNAAAWMRSHASVLDEFPSIKSKVSDVASMNEALVQRQRALADRARKVEDSLLNRELMAIDRDVRTPEEAIARAMQSPRKMAQLSGRLRGSEDARSALRRAVWDNVTDMQPGSAARFIEQNGEALRAAGFTDRHLDAIRVVDGARMIANRTRFPVGSAEIPSYREAFLKSVGIAPDVLSNRIHALHTGRTEKTWLITNILSNVMTRKQQQYMDEAWKVLLYDPAVARDVSESLLRGSLAAPTAKRLQARFFALGLTPLDQDAQRPPVSATPEMPRLTDGGRVIDEIEDMIRRRVMGGEPRPFAGGGRVDPRPNRPDSNVEDATFIGRAATRFLPKLFGRNADRAEEMLGKGASRPETWAETGWSTDKSGMLVGELSDRDARLLTPGLERLRGGQDVSLGEILDHPQMFDAYPSSFRTKVQSLNPAREPAGQRGWYDHYADEIGTIRTQTPEQMLDNLLHEHQHRVQDIEGFAHGAAPSMFPKPDVWKQDEAIKDLRETLATFEYLQPRGALTHADARSDLRAGKWASPYDGRPDPLMVRQLRDGKLRPEDVMRDIERLEAEKAEILRTTPSQFEQYLNTLGEVNARLPGQRLNMTEAQRRANFPWPDESRIGVLKPEPGRQRPNNPDPMWETFRRAMQAAGAQGYAGGGAVRRIIDWATRGKPSTVKIPGRGDVEARPIGALEMAADDYMKKAGRPGEHRVDAFPDFDENLARRVAEAFERMEHNPADPKVRRAYEAMIDETLAQYKALENAGVDFRFLKPGEADPYARSPALGYLDMRDNGRLTVFPTDQGFGSIADIKDNPLLKRVGRVGDKPDAVANDAFRAVHDAFGHFGPGNPFFRAPGEERAFQLHSRMYSPDARPAMTTETRGQNSWVNYGPYGERNRKASGADTVYADQKIGIMPPWTMDVPPVKKNTGGLVGRVIRGALSGITPRGQVSPREIEAVARNSGDLTQAQLRKAYTDLGITGYEPSPLVANALRSQPNEVIERARELKIADQDEIARATRRYGDKKFVREAIYDDDLPGFRLPSREARDASGETARAQSLRAEIGKAQADVDREIAGRNGPSILFDLSPEALNRRPQDVPQFYLPRAEAKETARLSGLGPMAARRLGQYVDAGGEGASGWYNLQQLRNDMRAMYGPKEGDERFRLWTLVNASTSMTNPIESNIRTASHLMNRALAGDALPQAVKLVDPNTGRTVQTMAGDLPAPYGSKAQIQHAQRTREFLSGEMDPVKNPKPVSYSQNLLGNWKPITSDTHYIRDVVGPGRYDAFGENTNLLPGEYSWLENVGRRVARSRDLDPAQMQAAAWVGGGPDTGLKSAPVPYLQALQQRVMVTSRMRGEPADVTYNKFLRGEIDLYAKGGRVNRSSRRPAAGALSAVV